MPLCRIGTRGSLLALTQTEMVRSALAKRWPDWEFELVVMKTTGDLDQKTPLSQMGGLGVFVKELEIALMEGRIDLAVHSLKDVPHTMPESLEIVSYFNREDVRDVLISSHGSLEQLPQGALIGTGSPRRIAQLRTLRPDLQFTELRGNIDTRIARAQGGDLDGIILAAAGLNRLSKSDVISQAFEPSQMLPAIAQGIVALEGRKDDAQMAELARGVEQAHARTAAELERGLMVRLGGGCKVPMAALAQSCGDEWELEVFLCSPDLQKSLRLKEKGSGEDLVEKLALLVEAKGLELGIPMPKDLPEHFLLQDRE